METPDRTAGAELEYSVRRELGEFVIERSGREPLRADDEGGLLFAFESDLTVELQALRKDLFFLHAGAVATPNGAVLLVGDSGAGKSTLTWSLVRDGLRYMSDELAPVSLDACVHPYPRALSLKELPPRPYEVPQGTLRTSRGHHVLVSELGSDASPAPRRLSAIFFLEPGAVVPREPAVRPTGTAEAAARLLANVLNPRSHPGDGLDAALEIARSARSFELRRAEHGPTSELVRAMIT